MLESRARVAARDWKPRNVVWELTLACNLRCGHCGSRAGRPRPDELTTDECLGVVQQLADLGAELVTLSGGEPTVRKDWDLIARAIAARGILVNMVTNGVYRDEAAATAIAQRAIAAGMSNVGVSIDGPEAIHDAIRGEGRFARTAAAVRAFVAAGLKVAILTTVNKLNLAHLGEVRALAMDLGASMWRLQLAKPMGTMDDHREWVIEPPQLLTLIPMLAQLKKEGGIDLRVGDSIGYYGPHDKTLRGRGWRGRDECWRGCQAGMQVLGIEANGGIKGCLSLQAKWGDTDPFVEGNLREQPLEALWNRPGAFTFNRDFALTDLTGDCGRCRHGSLCRGGARCVSSAVAQVLTEDPYCYARLTRDHLARSASWKQPAAAAAAVLLLAAGPAGCGDADYGIAPDYGVPYDTSGDATQDAGDDADTTAAPEYGVFPDASDTGNTSDAVSTDYGVFPDVADTASDSVAAEYGVFPDTVSDSVATDYGVFPDATDTAGDSVSTDYGVFPDAG